MRFIGTRTFARPVLRTALGLATGVFLVAALAGSVRLLPLLLAPGVPGALALPLARSVVGVALETAFFVATPLAFALTASRLVERGEARALFALGARPRAIVSSAWPAAALLALACSLAAASWGADARAPGRLVTGLVEGARAECAAEARDGRVGSARIPLVDLSWVCFPGEPPRVVGRAPRPADAAFSATSVELSDDLASATLADVALRVRGAESADLSLRARTASFRGLSPLARASNLQPLARALILCVTAVALAAALAAMVFVQNVGARPVAAAVGACGAAASLLTFSTLEASSHRLVHYALVPTAGLAAMLLAAAVLARSAVATIRKLR